MTNISEAMLILLKLLTREREKEEWLEKAIRKWELENIELAGRSDLLPKEYIWLARQSFYSVKIILARNSSIPQEAIEILAEDANSNIRSAVIENYNITFEILAKLAVDPCPVVNIKAQEFLGNFRRKFFFLHFFVNKKTPR